MIRASDSLDDLTSDLRHLSTLIGMITNMAIDVIDPDKDQCEQTRKEINQLSDLLWIARDMAEQVSENSDICNTKVIRERNAQRMTGGQRNG